MEPKSSRDLPGPKPRKDKQRETQNAAAKTPDKTNDWDRNMVHGDGDSIGIEEDEA
ncbi:hypothetical protein [Mesorhizobium sp.]|uniref:hypothetical protein n=1 Tax=Mesorhizobium sp. TaxID=1871066 RepID=UPI0025BC6831|nr:hypothetical protein [Mesorhizobium sp.]